MAVFHYEAINGKHKRVAGVVDAPDALKAVTKIQTEIGWEVNYLKSEQEVKQIMKREKELENKINMLKANIKKAQAEEAKSAEKKVESVFDTPLKHDHNVFLRFFHAIRKFLSFEKKEEDLLVLGVENWFSKLRQDLNMQPKSKKHDTKGELKKTELFKLDKETQVKEKKGEKISLKQKLHNFFERIILFIKRSLHIPIQEEVDAAAKADNVLVDKRKEEATPKKKETEEPILKQLWMLVVGFFANLFTKKEGDLSNVDLAGKIKKKEVQYDETDVDSEGGINLDVNRINIKEKDNRTLKQKIQDLIDQVLKSIRIWIMKVQGKDVSTQVIDVDMLTSKSKFRKGGVVIGGTHAATEGGKRVLVLKGFGKKVKDRAKLEGNIFKAVWKMCIEFIASMKQKKQKRLSFQMTEREKEKMDAKEALLIRGYVKTGNPVIDFFNQLNEWMVEMSKVKSKEKVTFYQLLAVMVNAGIPLLKSLKQLVEQSTNPKLKKILLAIVYEIENGASLSNAMKEFKDTFTDATVGMVEAGEASGQLGETLRHIAEQEEKSHNMKSKIKGAMIYPVTIIVVMLIAAVIIMIMVVPKITELFDGAGAKLPTSTRMLIATSSFLTHFWWLLAIIIGGAIFGLKMYGSTEEGKYYLDYLKLKLPVFGGLIQKASLARFTRQLSTLSASGLSIIKALKINADSVGNEIYRQEILETSESVKKGIGIAAHLENNKLFPSLVTNMIAVGEETAQLSNVAGKIADYYETEVDDMVKNMSSLMEPMVIVVIGAGVAFLVSAIMTPIMNISEVVG